MFQMMSYNSETSSFQHFFHQNQPDTFSLQYYSRKEVPNNMVSCLSKYRLSQQSLLYSKVAITELIVHVRV